MHSKKKIIPFFVFVLLSQLSSMTFANRLTLVTWEQLNAGSDVVVIATVLGASKNKEEYPGRVELTLEIEKLVRGRKYVWFKKKLVVRIDASRNPVRVGKTGLFFLKYDKENKRLEQSFSRLSAFEQRGEFCGSERDGGWVTGFSGLSFGEFLVEVPRSRIIDTKDCLSNQEFQGVLISEESFR